MSDPVERGILMQQSRVAHLPSRGSVCTTAPDSVGRGNMSNKPIEFTVPGKGERWQRRVQTKHGSYNPKQYVDYKNRVRDIAFVAMDGRPPLVGPVEMRVTVWWPRPKTKNRKRTPNSPYWMGGTPDADNLAKAIMDSVQTVAFGNDSQVAVLHVSKIVCAGPSNDAAVQPDIAQIPRTDVQILPLDVEVTPWIA